MGGAAASGRDGSAIQALLRRKKEGLSDAAAAETSLHVEAALELREGASKFSQIHAAPELLTKRSLQRGASFL